MNITLNIDDNLLNEVSKLTGIRDEASLVRRGLETLISQQGARRLAKLGGSEGQLQPIRRRRSGK